MLNHAKRLTIILSLLSGFVLAVNAHAADSAAKYKGEYTGTINGPSITFHFSINDAGHIAGGLVDRSDPDYAYGVPLEGQVKSNGDVNIFVGDHADYKEDSPNNLIGKISNDGVLTGRTGKGSVWNGERK